MSNMDKGMTPGKLALPGLLDPHRAIDQ